MTTIATLLYYIGPFLLVSCRTAVMLLLLCTAVGTVILICKPFLLQLCMRSKPLLSLTKQKLERVGREWSSATGNVITVPQNYYQTSIFQLHCLHGLTTIWISKYQNENYTKWSNWGNPSRIYILIKFVIAEYSCKCTMDVCLSIYFFSRNEGDNDFMNIILNELNTQVRFWSNRPLPVVGEVNISRLYCFCAAEGNFGFSDCRGGERSWSVCSGRTQWTGGQAGTTVRARACLWSSHIASEIRPSSEYCMFRSLGCWRFCRGRGLEKTAGSKAKPTAWHEGRKWRPCCSSTASLSHPQRNKATTLRFSYILVISNLSWQKNIDQCQMYIMETFA